MNTRQAAKPRINRQSERYWPLRELSLTYEGHSENIPVRPPDLSSRGMFINTASHFPEGAVLNLRFRLARSDFVVSTRCEVRYCLPGVGIGVEFVQIPPEAVRAIEREIRVANRPLVQKS